MANCKASILKEKRKEQILNTLKSNPGKSVKTSDLMKMFDINYKTFWNDLKDLKKQDKNVITTRGAVTYNCPDTSSILLVVKPERYSEDKNHEGYPDPTANNAIKDTDKEESIKMVHRGIPKEGEVWQVTAMNKKSELYIIVAVNYDKEYATCISYVPNVEAEECDIKLYSKPLRYFERKSWGMPGSYMSILKERLAEYLGIGTKIVEKIVEVPVEVNKTVEVEKSSSNGSYTKADVDALLAIQRADIYEECFKALVKRGA